MEIKGRVLTAGFFAADAQQVARNLLGKVLRHRVNGHWLAAQIVETEAYYRRDKASHASLGFTPKRSALFMPPGTIYMYYARGRDSFNVSCGGAGNAVLFKAAVPYLADTANLGVSASAGAPSAARMLRRMQCFNPLPSGKARPPQRLCAGQTLLCRALGLRVPDWDQGQFAPGTLELLDVGYSPGRILRTTRLGIPPGRDEHLPYRFIDFDRADCCTHNPLTLQQMKGREPLPAEVKLLGGAGTIHRPADRGRSRNPRQPTGKAEAKAD